MIELIDEANDSAGLICCVFNRLLGLSSVARVGGFCLTPRGEGQTSWCVESCSWSACEKFTIGGGFKCMIGSPIIWQRHSLGSGTNTDVSVNRWNIASSPIL